MGRKRYCFTEAEAKELRAAVEKSKKKMDYRRLMIIQAAGSGKRTIGEIAQEYGVSKSHVSQLSSLYRREGLAGVLTHVVGGNHRNMSEEAEKELLEGFRVRAEKGEMLEVAAIQAAYEEKLGREVSKSVVYSMLARHKWRKVMPRSRHPKKASDEAIEAYKKNHGQDQNTYKTAW